MVVEGWLERAAAVAPGVTAIETPTGSATYAQLLARARAGAGVLQELGVRPGERVGLALAPGLAFAQGLHACLLAGAVAVPIDLRLGIGERELLSAETALVIDEELPTSTEAASPAPGGGHDLDATAVVIYTSGTTAAPKAVELTYGNVLWSALGSAVALGLDTCERWLCTLPLSHVGGLSILLRSSIYATTAVVHERFDTERALRAIKDEGITLVSVVATTLTRLLDAGLHEPVALRCALTGGGPVSEALLERARLAGVPVSQTYGLTEACSQVTTGPIAALGLRTRAAAADAGTPLFCTRVRIAAGGEIMVSGPTIAPGSLDEHGWLATGDLGELDELGRLRVTGRQADTIVSGGENVAPAEVEAILEAHPGVLEAAVLGRADERWGEAVCAIVVARPEVALDERTLREHCASRLASYKVPKRVALVSGPLPRTRSGKLIRRELP